MEIFSLVLAIILVVISLTVKRLRWLYELFLSGVTGFFCLKIFYPHLYLWSPREYNLDTVYQYFQSGMFVWSICSLLLNILFFHWAFKMIMMRLFERPINFFHRIFLRKLNQWGERNVGAFYVRLARRMIRFGRKYRVIPSVDHVDVSEITFRDFLDLFCSFFAISIHTLLCCVLMGLGLKFLILLAIVTLVFIPLSIIFVFPMTISFFRRMMTTVAHELQRPNIS